ncbi:MAG: carboxypeptidase-like regulatory domain-containing protein [Pseudomonadota bacterium]
MKNRINPSQHPSWPFAASASTLAIAALVTACGGGSSSADSTITLSGTAATGAPMAGATVVVKDSTGSEVQSCAPCTVGADGSFSIQLKAAAKGIFVLIATQEGQSEPEVSVVNSAQSTTVNVSPITTLVAARLASNGDPVTLSSSSLTADQITLASSEVKTALKPLLDAAGVDANADPMTMAFKTDSTGLDKVLDVLGKPNIVRSNGTATVTIELKASGSDTAADGDNSAAKITLAPGVAPVASANFTDVNAQALPADGMSVLIQNLLTRMESCFGTNPTDRRSDGATLASHITGEVCKGLFVDNDPTKYVHNNTVVSQKGAALPTGSGRFTGAFKGIFGTVKGLKHDLPEYRYTVKNSNTTVTTLPMNGDVVFTARWTVTDPAAGSNLGQSDVSEYHARTQNGVLKLIGNQSNHDLNISAQARRQDMPAVANYAYLSTGYHIGISERRWNDPNDANTDKVSIYEQVVVTSPSRKIFTFKPHPSNQLDYLSLVKNGTITKGATIRLNGAFLNAATSGHPSARFTNEFWATPADWTDDKIAAIPQQGNWTFEITLTPAFAAANSLSPVFRQYRRTINRAPTLTELQAMAWPALKVPALNALTSATNAQGVIPIGNTAESLTIDGWDVPTGAWAPTSAKVYSSAWDEGADLSSTARQATIRCSGTGAHCEKANGVNTGKFINTGWGALQLTGRDSKRMQMALHYSMRKTTSD